MLLTPPLEEKLLEEVQLSKLIKDNYPFTLFDPFLVSRINK